MENPTEPQASTASPSKTKSALGTALGVIGGLVLFANGLMYFAGRGSNGLLVLGGALIIASAGMRGVLSRRV